VPPGRDHEAGEAVARRSHRGSHGLDAVRGHVALDDDEARLDQAGFERGPRSVLAGAVGHAVETVMTFASSATRPVCPDAGARGAGVVSG
jgi:hypothetical protein